MTVQEIHGEKAFARFLIRHGLLPEAICLELEQAFQNEGFGRVWDWLGSRTDTDEEALAQGVAAKLHLPYASPGTLSGAASPIPGITREVAERYQLVGVGESSATVSIAIANPFDRNAIQRVQAASGKPVQLVVASPRAIREATALAYQAEETVAQYLARALAGEQAGKTTRASRDASLQRATRGAAAAASEDQLLRTVLEKAIACGAEEIHLEPTAEALYVWVRIDGVYEEFLRFPKWLEQALVRAGKALIGLDPAARPIGRRGAVCLVLSGRSGTLEGWAEPSAVGVHLAFRWRESTRGALAVEELGMEAGALQQVHHTLRRGSGLVLVAGGPHSGKSTTLNALALLCAQQGPVFPIDGSYWFDPGSAADSHASRYAPNLSDPEGVLAQSPASPQLTLVTGRIADSSAARFALQMASNGWLVLAESDCTDAVGALWHLFELADDPSLVTKGLGLVIAQALPRKVCAHCQEPYEPERGLLVRLHVPASSQCYVRGRGCGACRKTGYRGRVPVFQFLPISPEIRAFLPSVRSEQDLRFALQHGKTPGLTEELARLVLEGSTTVEEAWRVLAGDEGSSVCPHQRTAFATPAGNPFADGQEEASKRSANRSEVSGSDPSPCCGPATTPQPAASQAVTPSPAGPPLQKQPAGARPPSFDVLVVEDEPDARRLVQRVLERSGLPLVVRTAESGGEALERIEAALPHLLVLDVMMPGMSGFELCERLRSDIRTAFLPVLMLTALDSSEHRTRAFLLGTDDYLTKPFSRDELVARVRRILQRTYGYEGTTREGRPNEAQPRSHLACA